MNNYKKMVFICCDDSYIRRAIIALEQFCSHNPDYRKVIMGKQFNLDNTDICEKYNIRCIQIDLSGDFIDLDKRKYGKNYPIECFYHFYAYKLFMDYDILIQIEPDIYTNKKIDIDFGKIKYVAGSYTKNYLIGHYSCLMRDHAKIKKIYGAGVVNQPRLCSGVKVYNPKGLAGINFYEKIVEYYQTSIKINAQRCGDDSLMVMYQLLNPSHVTLLQPEFHVIFYKPIKDRSKITFFHFGGPTPKYWLIDCPDKLSDTQRYFYNCMIRFIDGHFPDHLEH